METTPQRGVHHRAGVFGRHAHGRRGHGAHLLLQNDERRADWANVAEMTPRERWLALLDRKTPDRIPTDYQATEEVTTRLRRDLGCADNELLYRRLHIDARHIIEPVWDPDRYTEVDMWGIRYRSVSYGSGTYIEPDFFPLAACRERRTDSRPSVALVRRFRLCRRYANHRAR